MELSADRHEHDADHLERIRRRDEAALGQLYDRFGGPVYSMLLRMTGDQGAAEELLQDVFLTVWRSASTWDPRRGSVQAWIVAIARHRAIDYLRTTKNSSLPLMHDIVSPEAGPDEAAVKASVASAVRESLDDLPKIHRDVLDAIYFAGLTHHETAQMLGIPVGTVKSRLRLALQRLARSLRLRGVVR